MLERQRAKSDSPLRCGRSRARAGLAVEDAAGAGAGRKVLQPDGVVPGVHARACDRPQRLHAWDQAYKYNSQQHAEG